jgi:hypothetical protein
MSKSIRVIRKYVRKKRPPERGTLIGVRLQKDQLALLDRWMAKQDKPMSRPEAVRKFLLEALADAMLNGDSTKTPRRKQ